jgi:hypothetical protein
MRRRIMKKEFSHRIVFFSVITGSLLFISMAAPQGGGEGAGPGSGPGSLMLTVIPFLIIVLGVLAIIRDIKAIKYGDNTNLAVAALVLTILLMPVGIIVSFAAVKKTEKQEIPKGRAQPVPADDNTERSNNSPQSANRLSNNDFISKLPFKKMAERNKNIPPKILPFINHIAVGIIILLVVGVFFGIFSGTSTGQLEKQVLKSIQEQFTATDVKLVKINKNLYSGIVYGETAYGLPIQKPIVVVSDGRNFQWEFEN